MQRSVSALFATGCLVACAGSSSPSADGASGQTEPDASSLPATQTAPTTAAPVAAPPDAPAGATVVEPETVAPDDMIRVATDCGVADLPRLTAVITDASTGQRVGPLLEVPTDGDGTYVGEFAVPYWVPTGQYRFDQACNDDTGQPVEPAIFDVVVDDSRTVDMWRPTTDAVVTDPEPRVEGDKLVVQVNDGDVIAVMAECDPSLDGAGARFIVWDTASEKPGFVGREFPAQATPKNGDGGPLVITAQIPLVASDYETPFFGQTGGHYLSAVCVATASDFHPDSVGPPEQQRVQIELDGSPS